MLGHTPETAKDPAAQTRETLARINRTMEFAGFKRADVVDSMIYLTDLDHFARMNDEYRTFFGKDFPARATVGTGLMAPGALIEIMVTAVKP